jgi:hypothetical protein
MATVCVTISCSDGKKGFRRTADQITGRYSFFRKLDWWENKTKSCWSSSFTTDSSARRKKPCWPLCFCIHFPPLSLPLPLFPLPPSLKRVPFYILILRSGGSKLYKSARARKESRLVGRERERERERRERKSLLVLCKAGEKAARLTWKLTRVKGLLLLLHLIWRILYRGPGLIRAHALCQE